METENRTLADRTREYNEFGPWIISITEPEMMPALFRPFYRETENPLMLIKIPRKIERRAASPMMDLYDFVIGAFDKYLYILRRNAKNVTAKTVDYRDIMAVKRSHAILKGELTLFLPDEQIKIAYSTVSDDIVLELIRLIQEKQAAADNTMLQWENLFGEYEPFESGAMDLYYENLCEKLKAGNGGLKLLAYQPEICVGRYSAKFITRLIYKKIRMTRCAFLSDGRVLAVIGSDMTARNRTVDKIAYYYLFINIAGISSVHITDYNVKKRLQRLEIHVSRDVFGFLYDSQNGRVVSLAGQLSVV